ncbi:hypothetical protein VTI28DRAFT_2648 [Corynascus sepedonium]
MRGAGDFWTPTVHGLWSQSRRNHEDISIAWNALARQNSFLSPCRPTHDLALQSNIFLDKDTFSKSTVMVQTRLAIFWRIDGKALSETNLPELPESPHLPTDAGVVVWIYLSRDKAAAPVDSTAELCEVLLPQPRKVMQPVFGIGKFVNLLTGNAQRHHGLELVLCFGRL